VTDKQYKYTPASPEVIKEWHDTEGKWWADNSMLIVTICALMIFSLVGMMGLTMYLIQIGVNQ